MKINYSFFALMLALFTCLFAGYYLGLSQGSINEHNKGIKEVKDYHAKYWQIHHDTTFEPFNFIFGKQDDEFYENHDVVYWGSTPKKVIGCFENSESKVFMDFSVLTLNDSTSEIFNGEFYDTILTEDLGKYVAWETKK